MRTLFRCRRLQYLLLLKALFFLCANSSTEIQFVQTQGYLPINDYVGRYPFVPFATTYSVQYFEDTDTISQTVELNTIEVQLRYLDDEEKTYYEYEHTEEGKKSKGKLFLKLTKGHFYQIVEVKFVSYKVEEQDKEQDATKDTVVTADEENENFIIPSVEDAEQGSTIFLDLILLDENERNEWLYRYDTNQSLLFFEQYAYTSKGALQRLIRSYSDGSKERFIYYFSTGGLKEIYNQNKDGSTYVFRYTISGDLTEKQIRDLDNMLVYDERNKYSNNGKLTQKIEVFYDKARYVKKQYQEGRLQKQLSYELKLLSQSSTTKKEAVDNTNNKVAESFLYQDSILGPLPRKDQIFLLYEEEFNYDQEGKTTESQSNSLLSDYDSVLRYNNEAVLEKEQVYKDGQLEREIIFGTENEREEVFYYKGKKVLRILYKDTIKIKEEVLEDGEVIEVRE